MNIEEFKKLENRTKKIEFLMKYWKIDRPMLVGLISVKEDGYLWIDNICDISGERNIKSPFSIEREMSVYCKINNRINDLQSVKAGDKVIFSFDISTKEDRLSERPITACTESVRKLIDIDESEIKDNKTILEFIKEKNIKPSIHRIMFEEEIEKKLIENLEDEKLVIDILRNNSKRELEEIIRKKKIQEKKLKDLNEELIKREKLRSALKKYGFSFEDNNQGSIVEGKTNISKDRHIEYIQKYLAFRESKKLYYSTATLEQFYAGLCTNQLLVLSGQPGTGKTSLVEGFCDAIAAKLKIVSVQPNWTDNQDLLGFFNPIEGTYISTPFLDAIIEAENNPDQLHIICLDEMNLAHVEYYFSEFLSKMQSEQKKVTLYSEYLYREAREELLERIEFFIGKREEDNSKIDENINSLKSISFEEHYKLKKKWNSLNRYQHEIKIPDNVRFVGTINKDETTKNLSPKVIDRSYIMEIDNYTKELVEEISKDTQKERKKYNENLYLNSQQFNINNIDISSELENQLVSITNILKKVDIALSNRLYRQIEELSGTGIFNECDIFDAIVATKILPKINFEIDNEENDIRAELKDYLENTSISKLIFEKMNKNSDESGMGILTFWR